MATIIRTYEPKSSDKYYLLAIVKGLMLTMRRMFRRKDVIPYPEKKHVPAEGYRGLHRLNKDDNGRIKCVACEMCQTACPAHCIDILPEAAPWDDGGEERYPAKFEIDLLRCIYCGFCEIACPKDAIELTEIYDFASYSRDDLKIDREGLLKVYDETSKGNIYGRQNRGEKITIETRIS